MSYFPEIEYLLGKEAEGTIKAYVIVAAVEDEDGENLYFAEADDQSFHVSSGLVEFARIYLTKKMNSTLDFD